MKKKWDKLRGELLNQKESGLDDLGYSQFTWVEKDANIDIHHQAGVVCSSE